MEKLTSQIDLHFENIIQWFATSQTPSTVNPHFYYRTRLVPMKLVNYYNCDFKVLRDPAFGVIRFYYVSIIHVKTSETRVSEGFVKINTNLNT